MGTGLGTEALNQEACWRLFYCHVRYPCNSRVNLSRETFVIYSFPAPSLS